ncbi:MAG: hypothetical protein ABL929_06065 [Ferruginibacter sp.]|nr:hypothetical protein [Ferruginibacter sp.]
MKLLFKSMLIVLLFLVAVTHSYAQNTNTKPYLFAALPTTIAIDNSILSNAINYSINELVTLQLSPTFRFTGIVISNQQKYHNLQTVMIRAEDNNKTIFQISKITNNDLTVSYVGRIINSDVADGFVVKNINGDYALQKFETNNILEPCNL